MAADPHGTGPFGDEYDSTTVYFDTTGHDVFHRRGSFGRAKYRVRRYGRGDAVFLERKLRTPRLVVKRRTRIALDEVPRLAHPGSEEWAGRWFERRVSARCLQPVCQVSYRRMARGGEAAGGPIRLTLDAAVLATAADAVAFARDSDTPVLPDLLILELKFRNEAPALFKRLVGDLALTPRVASKYRCAVSALTGWPLEQGISI
jgi:hypothetical protein